jgi:hypothetical protein
MSFQSKFLRDAGIEYGTLTAGSSGGGIVVSGARNGLTVDAGGYIVLGQDVGEVGSPGELISSREVPLNGNNLSMLTGGDGYAEFMSTVQSMGYYRGLTGLQPMTVFTRQGLNPGTNPYGNFQIGWLDEGFVNPDGQIDAVMSIGYNTDGADGALNPAEASFACVLESHYLQGGVGDPDFEYYFQSVAKNGTKNRHMFLVVDKNNGGAIMNLQIDQLEIVTTNDFTTNPNFVYFSVNPSGEGVLIGPAASFYVGTPTPNADGSLKIQPQVGSGGKTTMSGAGFLQVAMPFQAEASGFVNGFSNFWFQSDAAPTRTRAFIVLNSQFDGNEGIFRVYNDGSAAFYANVKFGDAEHNAAPTAQVHTSAGTAAAGNGQIKLAVDTALKTVPENGLFEYDGTNLYYTVGATRKTVTLV